MLLLALVSGLLGLPGRTTEVSNTIYFSFGMAEAFMVEDVFDQIAATAKGGAVKEMVVIGHCDSAEEKPEELSLARAQGVADQLRQRGVPAHVAITVSGKGSADLARPTRPGVREPLNRCVVVTSAPPAKAAGVQFSVYFESDTEAVNAMGVELVKNIVGLVQRNSAHAIVLTGYCDGSEQKPAELSLTRAQRVAEELRRAGLPAEVPVTVLGLEANGLPKKTAPDDMDPLNRRVTVAF